MAFKDLRPGSTIYFFYKTNSPKLDIGQVMSEPNTRIRHSTPQQGQLPYMPQFTPQEQVIDLSVKLAEKVQPIEGLSPLADIQDCGNGLYISCSREAINTEVLAHKQVSDIALAKETLEMHKTISDNCAEIHARLNPEIAERQKLEKENIELKQEIVEIKGMMATLLNKIEGQKKPANNGNNNKTEKA